MVDANRRELVEEQVDESIGREGLPYRQEEVVVNAGDFADDISHTRLSQSVEFFNVRVQRAESLAIRIGDRHTPTRGPCGFRNNPQFRI